MKSFLQQVADYYLAKDNIDLSDYIFVFPNKRSALFMQKHLKDGYKTTGFMPRLVTITAFTQDFNRFPLASSTELLFNLYEAYVEVMASKKITNVRSFDSFVHWGNILLSDFNDIDAYIVNAAMLFKNIKDINETQSTYLTDEQEKVAKILGITRDLSELKNDVENFWVHAPHNGNDEKPSSKFVSLWEILNDLYTKFNEKLDAKGIAYSGKLSRLASQIIKDMGVESFGGKRFVFVGFNVLSTARIHIFKHLQTLGIADFFWDVESPMLNTPGCKAGALVLPLAESFPMPDDFHSAPIHDMPIIDIYPVPSNVGQTKIAGEILRNWHADLHPNQAVPVTTGVVLPNESLLMPMLYSLPAEIKPINVAMRVNFANTPFANFLSSIMSMQEKARIVKGNAVYFYDHVLPVLSHPYINLIDGGEAEKIKKKIRTEHLLNISASELVADYPNLAFIFEPVINDNEIKQTHHYLNNILDVIENKIKRRKPKDDDNDNDDDNDKDRDKDNDNDDDNDNEKGHEKGRDNRQTYELDIIKEYRKATDDIFALADKYAINMQGQTFFGLLRQLIALRDLQFKGDPVMGLQIMGMRDSRALDFENLIITSLNERIMPKHNATPTLIPPSLRAGYGLPTSEQEEISWSYQFYRLISRAKRISLIYDNRLPDMATGEISRYLVQLQMLKPEKTRVHIYNFKQQNVSDKQIEIDKSDPFVKSLLSRYLPSAENGKCLSASMLKNYITCPLKFFLQNVMGLNIETTDQEFIDPASYGDIIHKVAELFYKDISSGVNNGFITADYLERLLNDKKLYGRLLKLAVDVMNDAYYKNRYPEYENMPGEGRVIAKLVVDYVRAMLRAEITQTPFKFVAAEDDGGQHTHHWQIDDKHAYNFTMKIDRIDSCNTENTRLRFIDYKTGSDEINAPSPESLFTDKKYGAIFQLLLYCLAYSDIKGVDNEIQPIIYKLQNIPKDKEIKPIKLGKKDVSDFRQLDGEDANTLKDEFRSRLVAMLDEIFDTSDGACFTRTDNIDNCRYCSFTHLCGRFVPPKKEF